MELRREKIKIVMWGLKTTLVTVIIIAACFVFILGMMFMSYESRDDLSGDIIGTWNCVQFYKNQESFFVSESQSIVIKIENGRIDLQGSKNASIFRGAQRSGTYTVEGGNILNVNMGNEQWTCTCVFTADGLLRMTISEAEVVLYLKR